MTEAAAAVVALLVIGWAILTGALARQYLMGPCDGH